MPPYLLPYAACFCVMSVLTFLFFFQRIRWRFRKWRGKAGFGFYPSSAALGNALQSLQSMAQSNVEYILEEKLSEEAEEEDAGGPEDPSQDLERQVTTLRRRKNLDRLTVRIPRDTQ